MLDKFGRESFVEFKKANVGRYDIPLNYDEFLEEKKGQNIATMKAQFESGKFDISTQDKMFKRLTEWGLEDKFGVNDFKKFYDRRINQLEELFILQGFAIGVNRQNVGEAYLKQCFKYVKKNNRHFSWEKLSGNNSRYLDDHGNVVTQRPASSDQVKSLDFRVEVGEVEAYICQKRVKDWVGGHQDNQLSETYRFAKLTRNARGYLPVIVLDRPAGPIPKKVQSKLDRENDNILVIESNDVYFLVSWLENEQAMAEGELPAAFVI